MFNKEFFESTRLSIISIAACVTDEKGNILYMNRPFRKLCRRYPEITDGIVSGGYEESGLCSIETELFGQNFVLYIEKGNSDVFPVIEDGAVYSKIETLSGCIKLPLFGGKVKGLNGNIKDTAEFVADMNIGYFPFEAVLMRIIGRIKEKSAVRGGRIQVDEISAGNSVCNASVFDISVVVGLLVHAMLESSPDKTVLLSAHRAQEICGFSVEINTNGESLNLFSGNTDASRVLKALDGFCQLFSFKLVCRTRGKRTSVILALPICNAKSMTFRNEDDKRFERSIADSDFIL